MNRLEMKGVIIVLLSVFIFIGCDDEDVSKRPVSLENMSDCYRQNEWNENIIAKELTGKWQWIYTENFWAPDEGQNTENENRVFEFLSDSTLNVFVKDELVESTQWMVAPVNSSDLFKLELDEPVQYLYGQIFLCDKILLFNDSYRDGTDNYFRKIE